MTAIKTTKGKLSKEQKEGKGSAGLLAEKIKAQLARNGHTVRKVKGLKEVIKGQPFKIKNIRQIQIAEKKFHKYCKDEGKAPSWNTFALKFMKVSPQTLNNYIAKGLYEVELLKIKNDICENISDKALKNKYNAAVSTFILKNTDPDSYKDKQEIHNTGDMTVQVVNYAGASGVVTAPPEKIIDATIVE